MTRDQLIAFLLNVTYTSKSGRGTRSLMLHHAEAIADFLVENGLIVLGSELPCFDAGCSCCTAHLKIERKYEDALDSIGRITGNATRASWTRSEPLQKAAVQGYLDRIKQHVKKAGR